IVHPAPVAHFFFIEGLIIMLLGKLDCVMVLKKGLQNDFSRNLSSSGAARHLRQKLKGAFGGAKIWKSESKVRSYNTHQGHSVNVVPFGNHLCAHQQVDLACMKLIQGTLKIVAASDR